MAQAVDWNAGKSAAIAQQYADLRSAVASTGEAKNLKEARDIERKGLFGSGIKQSDLQDFGNIAIKGAEFGESRMERKMDRAEKSFGRRQAADERRLASLQKRADLGDKNAIGEIKGIQSGMTERRNSFEDFMGKYQEKGLWGTKFGGEDVGYRTEGESKYSQAMRPKPGSGSGDESDWSNLGDLGEGRRSGLPPMRDFERSASQPGTDQEFRGGTNIKENAPPEFARRPKLGEGSYRQEQGGRLADKGAEPPPEAFLRDDITRSPSQPGGGISGRRSPGVRENAPLEADPMTWENNPLNRGAPPEAFLRDDIAPSSNKFEEGMMNTRRSGPVQDNAPYETFKNAFRNARRQRGAGGTFDWRGNEYTTDYK